MKMAKINIKIWGLLICLIMCLWPAAPVLAAGEVDAAAKTAAWLKEKLPEPAVGDEVAVLALLRGGYITQQEEYTSGLVLKLIDFWQAGDASLAEAADQALFLAAAGINVEKHTPRLYEKLSGANAANTSIEERCKVLIYISSVKAGGEFPGKDGLLNGLMGAQNEDGGFGGARLTALAVQALSGYYGESGVEEASIEAQFWLQLNDLGFGSFGDGGQEDVAATAEVIVAMASLGYDPEYADPEGASVTNALIAMSSGNGAYGAINEGAAALLGLVSKTRYDKKLSPVYDFKDVSPAEPLAPSPSAESSEAGEDGSEITGGSSGSAAGSSSGEDMQGNDNIEGNDSVKEKKSGISLIIIVILIVVVAFILLVVLIQLLKSGKNKRK